MTIYALTPGSGTAESLLISRFLGLHWARTITWLPNLKLRKNILPDVLDRQAQVALVFGDKLIKAVRLEDRPYRVIHIPWPCPDHFSELAALRELRTELDMGFNTSGRSGVNK